MVTPVEKRSCNKFCDFHNDKGHSTDECMQLKKQIEELVRAGKLSHLIKEIKQGRDQTKVRKKEALAKNKSLVIYMVQSWHRTTRQKVTQSFARVNEITFLPLTTSKGTEGLLVIEAEIDGHMIHRMYVDEGSSTEPLGQLRLLVTTGDVNHATKAWMNFMIVRSLSPYNGIIGRPGIREIQAVPSTAHEMLKFPVDGGIVTIYSTILILAECATVTTSSKEMLKEAEPLDMTGVPRSVAEHRLNIREGYSPIRQKKRGQALKRARAIQAEASKNASATYQWLVDKAFDSQIGRNIEVYVDDLVIKSYTKSEMLRDIDETLCTLRRINMKLNPKKYMFGAVEGMFLGYMISSERIKLCPDITEAVLQLSSPRTIKEVQSLNGKLASLNRFLSKSVEKSLALFKTLKKCIKKSDFH
ncbi:hypothetical protein Tco_0359590 [Tanacetum coccineum]